MTTTGTPGPVWVQIPSGMLANFHPFRGISAAASKRNRYHEAESVYRDMMAAINDHDSADSVFANAADDHNHIDDADEITEAADTFDADAADAADAAYAEDSAEAAEVDDPEAEYAGNAVYNAADVASPPSFLPVAGLSPTTYRWRATPSPSPKESRRGAHRSRRPEERLAWFTGPR